MLLKIDMLTCLHEKLKMCTGTHYTVHAEAISKEKVNRNVALNFFAKLLSSRHKVTTRKYREFWPQNIGYTFSEVSASPICNKV